MPFDLSRLAEDWKEGRGRFARGFSFVFWNAIDKRTGKKIENKFRPRVRIKHIDNKRALMDIASSRKKDPVRATLFDLKTAAFALTDRSHSLASACEAFGVEHAKLVAKQHGRITPDYYRYARRDTLATQELFEKIRREFERHPIDLTPRNALSPASFSKAYLRQMGIVPPMVKFRDFPVEVIAASMNAYYGGRAECRIRKSISEIVYTDFLSMYPSVYSRMDLWDIFIAETLEAVEATDEVQRFLDGVTLEQCFDLATWRKMNFVAVIEPQDDIMPVRAPYAAGSKAFNIGVNPLTAPFEVPFMGPDLVASKLLSGKSAQVKKAWRLVPHGKQRGLQPVKLRGEVVFDPNRDTDFFKTVIEKRKSLSKIKGISPEERAWLDQSLKTIANSGSYGILAQLDRVDLSEKEKVIAYSLDGPFEATVSAFERSGEFYFPPLAALITAGARLTLAMLEQCVRHAGGSYVFCDTDSMAITLPMKKVRRIVQRFESLNHYDRRVVREPILKIEEVNFDPKTGKPRRLLCYAVAAKRYALFTLDRNGKINVLNGNYSEHGLGHLLNPTDPEDESRDWARQFWELQIAEALGRKVTYPEWFENPAVTRISATTPELLRRMPKNVRPFGFLLAAHVAPLQVPAGASAGRFQLIGRYSSDPKRWRRQTWKDNYSDKSCNISTTGDTGNGVVRVKSYADVYEEYRNHPEPKSLGPGGEPCGPATTGELARRPVFGMYPIYVGKESHRYEEVEQGTIHEWDEVRSEYPDPNADPWRRLVVPVLQQMSRSEVARLAKISERHVARLRNLKEMPSPELRGRLTRIAVDFSRRQIGEESELDDLAACALFLNRNLRKNSGDQHAQT